MGSPVTAISEGVLRERSELNRLKMYQTDRVFRFYVGEVIKPKGIVRVTVLFRNVEYILNLVVFSGNSVPILSRDWMNKLKICKFDTEALQFHINNINDDFVFLKHVKERYKDVFVENTGKCKT